VVCKQNAVVDWRERTADRGCHSGQKRYKNLCTDKDFKIKHFSILIFYTHFNPCSCCILQWRLSCKEMLHDHMITTMLLIWFDLCWKSKAISFSQSATKS